MNLPPQLLELLGRKLRMRPGCRLTLQSFGGANSYVLEDLHSGQFFRMGLKEERLLRSLDGTRSGAEVLKTTGSGPGDLDQMQAMQFLQTLWGAGLVEDSSETSSSRSAPPRRKHLLFQNPLFIRIPMINPDRALTWLEKRVRWMLSAWVLPIWAAVMIAGGIELAGDLERFSDSAEGVFSSGNWLWLFVVFIFLKFFHELGHGLVCKHYGGRVPEAGLFFFLFTPLTYIDATSSWSMPSKWSRIQISLAGMTFELFLAAIAAIVWANTETGVANTIAYNAVITASVVTLLFNINPLLRYDGYYVLADLTESPNLYSKATVAANNWLSRVILGTPVTTHEPLWVVVYGFCCKVWRVLLLISISVAAILLFHGIGILLATASILSSALPQIKKGIAGWKKMKAEGKKSLKTYLRLAVLAAICVGILFIPIRPWVTVQGMVELKGLQPVRVDCPGFLKDLFVKSGEIVKKDQPLALLTNAQESTKLETLKTEARISEVRANQSREERDPQKQSQELERLRSLKKQIEEQNTYVSSLKLKSPEDGQVVGERLEDLIGSFVQTGKEIMSVGSESDREIRIAVPQEQGSIFRDRVGANVRILLPDRGEILNGTILRFEPTATREIRFQPLSALAGGPLAVHRSGKQDQSYELVEPVFYLVASLEQTKNRPMPGQICVIRCEAGQTRPVAVLAWEAIDRMLRRYIHKNEPRS